MKGMGIVFLVMLISVGIAFFWDSVPIIGESVHAAFDPTLGALLDWNVTLGLIIMTLILNLITTIIHKNVTDQDMLKRIKEEQKLVNEEMKLYKDNPDKTLELSKKSMELAFKTFPISMRPVVYTAIPFILLFRWITAYFSEKPAEVLGFMSGFWAYFVFFIITSIFWRKVLKVH